MAQLVLGAAGAVIGFYAGGPTGAQIGWAVGSAVGASYEASKKRIEGPRLNDLRITGTEYGDPIPWVMGSPRISGQIWWASSKREVAHSSEQGKGGGPTVTNYTYEIDVLYGLTDCEIDAVTRIWSNGNLVYNIRADATTATFFSSFDEGPWQRMTVYTGNAAQEPDPTYEASVGAANAPAYRGRGTVFIEGLQLDGSGQLPNLTFEVCTSSTGAARVDAFNSLSSASNPEWGSMTLDSTGATVLRAIYGSYYTVDATRYNYDGTSTLLYTWELQSGGFATVTGAAAKIESDTPVILFSYSGSSTNLRLYDATGSLIRNITASEAHIGDRVRAAYRGGVLAWGQIDTTSKRIYKHQAGVVTQSAIMADWVQAVCICTDAIYALEVNGGSIYKLALTDLSLTETITAPEAGAAQQTVVGGSEGVLHYASNNGVWRREGSSWVQRIGAISPAAVDNQTTFSDLFAFSGGVWTFSGVGISSSYTMRRVQRAVTPSSETLQETVEALCARAGLATTQIDASDLASITRPVRAVAMAQVEGVRGLLEQLRVGYGFDATVSDKLYFRPRGEASVRTLEYAEIGAGEDAAQDDPLPITVAADLEVPPQVAVQYRNASNDYQVGTEYSDRIVSTQVATQTVPLAIGLTPAEAKGVADTVVTDAWAALTSARFAVTLEHADLEPGDVVQVTDSAGDVLRLRLVRRTDERGILAFDAVRDDASVVDSQETTDTGYTQADTITRISQAEWQTLDIPILRDADDGPGFYVASKGSTATWPGAEVQGSWNGTDFTNLATVNESAVFGTCTTTLGNFTGVGVDEVNSVTVSVGVGTLASSTRDAMLVDDTINVMRIGSEVIRFVTATQTGSDPNVYKLTRLFRGQRGTEWAIDGHAASETCTLLRPQGLRRVETQAADIGRARSVQAVTLGLSAADVTATSFTDTGIALKPFAGTDGRVARDASNDCTITWKRRSRLSWRLLATSGDPPLGEQSESYEVEVYDDGTFTTLVRTITATTPSASYTAADQTGDGLTPGDPLNLRVYQLSATVGRGYVLEFTA